MAPKKRRHHKSDEEHDATHDYARECEELFGCTDLYEIIGLSGTKKDRRQADDAAIKKAYYKTALKYHPDRCKSEDAELAKRKFQALGKAYSVLSDSARRKTYDETGSIDDAFLGGLGTHDFVRDWQEWFAELDDFKKSFQGSEEELSQLRDAYMKYQGDMKEIILHVMGATYEDEERFATILRQWIDNGDVVAFDKFTKETKAAKERRRKWFQKEKKDAEKHIETMAEVKRGAMAAVNGDLNALAVAIRSKRASGGASFLEQLEAKYAKKK